MTTEISDKITIEIAASLNPSTAIFLPLAGVRVSSFDVTVGNISTRNVRAHNWNELANNAGRRNLRLSLEGYYQASSGELLLQQIAISGANLLVKISSGGAQLLIAQMQLNRFVRLQTLGQIESFRCELQNSNPVQFS